MLGIGGKFSASKGMVAVPDLSDLTRTEAKDLIASKYLVFGTETTSSNTSGSSKNGKVKTQSVASGAVVEYGSTIDFTYYETYTPPVYLVSSTPSSSTTMISRVYTGFGGTTYGPCINGTKAVTKYRFYDETWKTTDYITYKYSDGTSTKVEVGSSTSTFPTEIPSTTSETC